VNPFSSNSLTYPRLVAGDPVGVNVLGRDQRVVAQWFAVSGGDRFDQLDRTMGTGRAPLIEGCAIRLDCLIDTRIAALTYTIFITRVAAAESFDFERLVYLGGDSYESSHLSPAP
jgi:flavin reductase (DIM6/NTAB) family NADH-FMN oxidoreductase RutF